MQSRRSQRVWLAADEKAPVMFSDRPIVLLALGQTLIWAGLYYVFPALLLRWEQELGWSKIDLTAAITLAVLISGLCAPVAGSIIDRGRGPILLAGSAVLGGFGLVLLSLVTALWQFYWAWAIIGLAMSGCLYEPCFALVTRARGKHAKRGIVFITLAAGFASTISYPVMYSLAEAIGWRAATVVFGTAVIVFVAPVLWLGAAGLERNRDAEDAERPVQTEPRNDFLRKPEFWFLAIGFAFVALAHGATLHHLLPILNERGLPDEMAVLAASFIGPMQVSGRLAMMVSEKYASHHTVAITAFFMVGISIVMLLISGTSPAFLSAFVIFFGGAYGTVSILRPLIARDILGQQNFGAKSGALALPYLAGSATAPYLGSVLWGIGGYGLMLTILIGCIALGGGLYLIANQIAQTRMTP